MLDILLKLETGAHADPDAPIAGLEIVRADALRLAPSPRTTTSPGLVDIDGELVPFGPCEARAHPAMLRVLSL